MFYLAVHAAMRLGDDVSPVLLERLRRDPDASEITWHDAARTGKAKPEDRLQRERRRLALLHRSRQFLLSDEFSRVKAGRRC